MPLGYSRSGLNGSAGNFEFRGTLGSVCEGDCNVGQGGGKFEVAIRTLPGIDFSIGFNDYGLSLRPRGIAFGAP